MDIVQRAKNILFHPSREWEAIKEEKLTISDMFVQYVFIVAAIPAACGLIGRVFFGFSSVIYYNPYGRGFTTTVIAYVLSLIGVYILGIIIDALAPTFESAKDTSSSFKIAIFSSTAAWVGGVFLIIPGLSFLTSLSGIYSFYLLYTGLKSLKNPPKEKLAGYFVAALISSLVIWVIIGFVISAIMTGAYMRPNF